MLLAKFLRKHYVTPRVKPMYVTTLTPPPLGLALLPKRTTCNTSQHTYRYNRERLRGFLLCGVIHFPAHGNGINRTIQYVTANFVNLSHAKKRKVIWAVSKLEWGAYWGGD